jgi:Ca2+-binding EF-hand superfamily protein
MHRMIRFAALPLAALALDAGADAAPPLEAFHAVSDRNKDGKIDRHEFDSRQVDVFYFQDRDKDGALSAAELPKNGGLAIADADHNGDAKLQLTEFLEVRADQFEAADTDHDGTLSMAELKTR